MKLLVGLMGVGLLGAPAVYPPDIQLFGVGAGQTVIVEGDGCSLRVANTAVAEWVGGRVIGKARGATWLTAKCANGLTSVPVTVRKSAPNDSPDTPPMTDLRVYPKERILVGKDASQQLVAVAYYSDGSVRDVTGLVQYSSNNPDVVQVSAKGEAKARQTGETAVIVRTMGKAEAARILVAASKADKSYPRVPRNNFIDEHVFVKLEKLNIRPSELTSDGEFLRRVYVDAIGRPPTEEEARAFLESKEAGKRTRMVDWLLEQPEFAEVWALQMTKLTRAGDRTVYEWFRKAFAENKPYDKIVTELLLSQDLYKTLFGSNAADRAARISQIFLGVQDHLYGFAAFSGGESLARWMTRGDNPFFARAFVNRVWKRYLGRGLVEEVDDFRATNPPTNPALLDALAADFVRNKFNVRRLTRTIFLSRTYQLSATPNVTNREDSINYSRFGMRGMRGM